MKRFALLLLFAAQCAMAQTYGRLDLSLQSPQGQAISGAQVFVYAQSACGTATAGTQAQLYSSATGGTVSQPLITNGYGHASAYALPGCVTITYNSPFTGTQTFPDQNVFLGGGTSTSQPATFSNTGGAAPGTSFNGSSAQTIGPTTLGALSLAATSPQTIAGPLNAPILQQVINVQQYCTTPGTLDQSCFSNAIAYVVANGIIGNPASRRNYELHVPTGTYNFSSTVTIPAGIDIAIYGDYRTGTWGSIINVGTMTTAAFLVQADAVDFDHLVFQGTATASSSAIQLGDASHQTNDSHIENIWFNGPYIALNCFNASGAYFVNNTVDSGTPFGIYSNHSVGAVQCNYLIADSGNRFFDQDNAINLNGISNTDTTGAYYGNRFGGIFDHDGSNDSPDVSLVFVQHNTVQGTFSDNTFDDINLGGGVGNVVGPFTSYHPGRYFLLANSENNLTILDGSINGANFNNYALSPTCGAICLVSNNETLVSNVQEFSYPARTSTIPYGLYSDSGSVRTLEYGNLWLDYLTAPTDLVNTSQGTFSTSNPASAVSYAVGANVVVPATATLPYVGFKTYSGGSTPSDTCSSTVNNGAIEINVTPVAYQCTNATGSYAWNLLGGGTSSLTLTTTGSSGAATYSGGTLNIPVYSAQSWSSITDPTGGVSHTMAANSTTFTFNATTGSADLFKWTDTASNTGTGILGHFTTAASSTEIPWQADANGTGWQITAAGALSAVGSTTHGVSIPAGTAVAGAANTVVYGSDATNGYAEANENNTGLSRICTAANGVCATPLANITITVGTGSITANSCGSLQTAAVTGLTSTQTIIMTPNADVSSITGWSPSSSGQLYFIAYPTANTLNWKECNPTGSNLAPGSSTTWNVAFR